MPRWQNVVQTAKRFGGLEHHRDMDVLVEMGKAVCRREIGVEVHPGPEDGHGALPDRGVATSAPMIEEAIGDLANVR
jgi:hypothetical protein